MKVMKFQNVYQTNIDYDKTFKNLYWLGFKPAVTGAGESMISFRIMDRVEVMISPKGTVQVAWTDEKEKIKGLEILHEALVPADGEKEVVLKPLHQNISNIPYPEPKDFKLIWCEEGTQYFSFDRYSQLKEDMENIMLDSFSRLDFDAAQKRADLLYSSDVLPQSWKKQLEPLFTDVAFKKAFKAKWVSLFIAEMRNLIWKNSK